MSITLTYPFTTPGNYTFDSAKAEIDAGARLILGDNTGQTFNQPFTSDTGFTYNSTLAEFTGGQVQQKDQRPANSICGATYTTDSNLNWGAAGFVSLTGTVTGSPSVTGGKLVCSGNQGVTYSDTLIGGVSGTFSLKWKYTPAYTGAPSQNRDLVFVYPASGTTNRVGISHSPSASGTLRLWSNGHTATSLGTWSNTAGTEYTFELIVTANSAQLYVDGVAFGGALSISPVQSTNAVQLRVGGVGAYGTADGSFNDVLLLSTATQDETYTVPENVYLASKVELPQFSYAGQGTIQQYTALATTEGGAPRYVLNNLYWNGSIWTTSDGTYAQAASAADTNTNIGTLPLSDTLDVDVLFTDTATQASCNDLTATYTGQIYPTDNPTVLFNTGFFADKIDDASETTTVTGSDAVKYVVKGGAQWYYVSGGAATTTDGNTYAESSTLAEWATVWPTWDPTNGVQFQIKAFLHSDDGSSTPELTSFSVEYDYRGNPEETLDKCIVWGYSKNGDGTVNTDNITINLSTPVVAYKDQMNIENSEITVTPAADGYWEVELIETTNMTPGTKWRFKIAGEFYNRAVPNQATCTFWDLP